MTKAMHHVRANAIAYLALFVALGGTGYAAIDLGPRSVGARELKTGAVTTRVLRNGSVTARKLDPNSIGASVRVWAEVTREGQLRAGSPGARVVDWVPGAGTIQFPAKIPFDCFSVATVNQLGPGFVNSGIALDKVGVNMENGTGAATTEAVLVVVLCPGR
jgi:hypothetical protein